MSSEFEREVVVYIWRFGGITNITRTGHASLKLKAPELKNAADDGKNHCYISWWPQELEEGQSFLAGTRLRVAAPKSTYKQDKVAELSLKARQNLANKSFEPRGKQTYVGPKDPMSGLPISEEAGQNAGNWGASADEKIRLPGLGCSDLMFGLDMNAMYRWWQIFRKSGDGDFSIFNKKGLNCSKLCYLVLKAGGATKFAKLPRCLVLNPNIILTWTQEVRKKIDAKNQAAAKLNGLFGGVQSRGQKVNLLDPGTWKKESSKNTSIFSRRRGQVKSIDGLLAEYDRVKSAADMEGLETKCDLLDQILGLVNSHLTLKTDSKRADAVLDLGEQALNAYRAAMKARIELLNEKVAPLVGIQKRRPILDQINELTSVSNKLDLDDTWSV